MRRDALIVVLLAVLAGCNSAVCSRQTDCATGEMCSTLGMCVEAVVRADARTGDGGILDAAIDAPTTIDAPKAIDAPKTTDGDARDADVIDAPTP